jgi:signal transduction histidine kinase
MSKFHKPYIVLVSLAGLLIVVWALLQSATWENVPLLIGMMLLAGISQAVSTISSRSGITFGVSQAVTLATVAVLGPSAAVLVAAVDGISIWLINIVRDRRNWKGSFEQLAFNTGMIVIAAFAAAMMFVGLQSLVTTESIPLTILIWTISAVVFDQVNIWLVAIVISLQHGVSPVAFWIQQRWAMPLNILVIAVGGSLVAYGAEALGVRGLFLLAVPLLLFAYPFRLYITSSEAQIGELEKTNQVLADTNEELTTVSRAKERLLAVLSHDMRTPLSTIHLYAILLMDRPDIPTEKRARMLRSVLDSEETLARMVDNILELEQIRSGQLLDLDMASFDLLDLIQRALNTVQAHADDKQISLSFASAPGPVLIEADAEKMIRTFQNLLSNAIKYSPEGSSVSVTVDAGMENTTIAVTDNGYGIPAEELDYVFEPFRRVEDNKRWSGGSGLGLSIVKEYVEAHRGKIDVASTQGEGTTFTIQLPMPVAA